MAAVLKHVRFVIRQPLLVIRIGKGFFRALILRKPVLRSVELAVTYQCQCACDMCYAEKLADAGRKILTVDQIRTLWEQCHRLGAIHVNITGGEPLLRKDLCDVIRALKPDSTMVSLVTNGVLLTPERIDRLTAAGLRYLQISIDSLNPQEHDRMRGVPGCFRKAIDGAAYAKSIGLPVCLSTVISHDALKTPEKIWEMIRFAEKMDTFLLLNLAATAGGWTDRKDELLTQEDMALVAEFRKHPAVRQDVMYNFRGKSGCPAGTEKLYVTAYGDVTPCDMVHISFGNVLDQPLKTIWERMRACPPFRKQSPQCLRCIDREFVSQYVDPIADVQQIPVPAEAHPCLRPGAGKSARADATAGGS